MTPEEAVERLRERLTTGRLKTVKELIDACVATAKEKETRRCAALVRKLETGNLADIILRTGGLEAETEGR